jgi:hypothetical protein
MEGAIVKLAIRVSRVVSPTTVFAFGACVVGAALLAGCGSKSAATTTTVTTAAASASQKMTMYSVATNEQFLNHEDDRARGKGNNPFGNFKDTQNATKESGTGPFAGDRAVFTFSLYSDASLKTSIGSATFICQYSFNKNALCDTSYVLAGGTLTGAGAFNFNAKTFAVAITGGTGKYRSLTGDVEATPAAKHSQHLAFVLN